MAAGFSVIDKDINNKAGQLVTSLWDTLDTIHRFKLWFDDHNDTFLNGLGITGAGAGDTKLLRDSFADLGGSTGLWAVSHGLYIPPGVNNFFSNAKSLSGTNFTG